VFGSRDKVAIGIDIGVNSIKLVELEGSYSQPKLLSWGAAKLMPGGFCESKITDFDAVGSALQRLLIQSGATGDIVVVSVSASQAITKILAVPNDLNELELEEQVYIEALQVIPYPLDEVCLDFAVIGPSATNSSDNEVLLVACRRSLIQEYINLIDKLGLRLSCIDIDTYALERVYRSKYRAPNIPVVGNTMLPVAIFDIGYSSTHLVILDSERVLYSRHQNFGASSLITEMGRKYALQDEAAEKLLYQSSLPSDCKIAILEPFVTNLRQEVEQALQFFYSSSAFSTLDHIILSGACSSLSYLAHALQEKSSMAVTVLDAVNRVEVTPGCQVIGELAPTLTIAYGLSLRGLKQ